LQGADDLGTRHAAARHRLGRAGVFDQLGWMFIGIAGTASAGLLVGFVRRAW